MITQVKTQLRRLLPKNAFARGVSVLVGGTASVQVLLVLSAPLLTRLYSAEDFGLLAVYASLLSLIGVISSLRYELAIPLPEDDGEAANILVLCLILIVTSTILTCVIVFMLGSAIAAALGVPKLAGYLWLLPVGVLLTGFYSVFNYWALRTKRFTTVAGTKLRQALTTIAVQLAAFKFGGIALVLGHIAGQGVGTTTLGLQALKNAGLAGVGFGALKKVMTRYKQFPIFSTWAGFMNSAGQQLPPLIFAALFSPAAAGLYALAHRVLTLPMSLVGAAIGQVFFATAAAAHRAGNLGQLVAQLNAKLVHIALPLAILLVFLGPTFFAVVFGQQWRLAGEMSQWMAPWLYFQFISSPISTVFSITERQGHALVFQSTLLVLRIIAIAIGTIIGDLLVAVAIFSMLSAIGYVGFIFWIFYLSNASFLLMWRDNIHALGFGLLAASPVILNLNFSSAGMVSWGIGLILSTCIIMWRYWILLRKAY